MSKHVSVLATDWLDRDYEPIRNCGLESSRHEVINFNELHALI
jgi:hypothetical protein